MTTKDIPELGRIPAFVSRYWRPAKAVARCEICGREFYHIIPHVMECMKAKEEVEREAAYRAALKWVDRLEPPHLRGRGESLTAHLYNADGELLVTLDQIVNAILNNDLAGMKSC